MVLYNSPLAVAALLVGLALVTFGLARILRAYRPPTRSAGEPDTHGASDSDGLSPTLREVLRTGMVDTILAVIGVVVLMLVLILAISHDLG